jgi:hypothetical protein
VCSVNLTIRALPKDDQFKAAAAGDPEWLTLSLKHAVALLDTDEHVSNNLAPLLQIRLVL